MEELRKCPFCGGKPAPEGKYMFSVICTKCGTRTNWYKTKKEAIEAWNRRESGINMNTEDNIIRRPCANGYCLKCKHHYLSDGNELMCRSIQIGMSSIMCWKILECRVFDEKIEKS